MSFKLRASPCTSVVHARVRDRAPCRRWTGRAISRLRHDRLGADVRARPAETARLQIPARLGSDILRPQRIGGAADAEGLCFARALQICAI